MKAKTLPATTRIMRLLEILSGYAFNLYFVKGKDIKICDFLSRIDVDRGNPGEVIPISFNSFSMLNIMRKATLHQANKLLIATRGKTQAEGVALPPLHDNANPPSNADQPTSNGPVPVRHFEPNPLLEVPETDQIPQETVSQKPVQRTESLVASQDPFDTQMEVPFSEDIVEPVFKRPEMTDFEIPPVLEEMTPDGALIHKHLPKQADIDRIMTQINRKYLKRMHLPCSLKDMQAAYIQSPHFCDIQCPHVQQISQV